MKSLNSLGWQTHDHLKQYRPKEFQCLKKSGELFPHLKRLQDQVSDRLFSLEQSGLRPDEAMEIMRDQVYPPSEPGIE